MRKGNEEVYYIHIPNNEELHQFVGTWNENWPDVKKVIINKL